jgi:hypothetical protein
MEGSRIVFPALEKRSCEVGMQSEPGWPRIILDVYPRPPGEEGAPDRDSFRRTGRLACLPQASSFLRCGIYPSLNEFRCSENPSLLSQFSKPLRRIIEVMMNG